MTTLSKDSGILTHNVFPSPAASALSTVAMWEEEKIGYKNPAITASSESADGPAKAWRTGGGALASQGHINAPDSSTPWLKPSSGKPSIPPRPDHLQIRILNQVKFGGIIWPADLKADKFLMGPFVIFLTHQGSADYRVPFPPARYCLAVPLPED